MTEQQKAEAYVYKKRPALMKHVGPKDAPKSNPGAIFTYHPINLQDIAYCLSDEARCELMDVYDFTKSPQEQEERVWEWFNKEVKVC